MNRLKKTFDLLRRDKRKALITFTMAGDPDEATSLAVLEALAEKADILEIGMPFTDPMADGPAIQAAGLRALASGMSLIKTLAIVQQFRSKNHGTPIILMGYFNPILQYGSDKFISDCKEFGVDGLILVDLPPEEANEIALKAQQKDISLIRLLTPTTTPARLEKILKGVSGFLYYVSITGVTGTASADPEIVGKHIADIKKHTDLPIVAGFGIRTPDDARSMAAVADGVVIGSALVQEIAMLQKDKDLPSKLGEKVAALQAAVHSVSANVV